MLKINEYGVTYLINTNHIIYISVDKGSYTVITTVDRFFTCSISANPDLDNYVKGVLGK